MKDERGVPIAFHLDGGELDAKIVRAGEILKEAAAVEELAEALVAFVIVRSKASASPQVSSRAAGSTLRAISTSGRA